MPRPGLPISRFLRILPLILFASLSAIPASARDPKPSKYPLRIHVLASDGSYRSPRMGPGDSAVCDCIDGILSSMTPNAPVPSRRRSHLLVSRRSLLSPPRNGYRPPVRLTTTTRSTPATDAPISYPRPPQRKASPSTTTTAAACAYMAGFQSTPCTMEEARQEARSPYSLRRHPGQRSSSSSPSDAPLP